MDIVKAGWLQRRTTILKKWKREWFVLTSDARFLRMSSPAKRYDKADDIFRLNRCRELRIGSSEVHYTVTPPDGSTREHLMELVPSVGDTWTLCTESTDDLLAWKTSFEEVRQLYIERMQQQYAQRTNTQIPSNSCDSHSYRYIYDCNYPRRVYQAADGSSYTVIIVDRDLYYEPDGVDITTGVLTGVAIGSLFLLPLFLLPLILL